jgi:transposase
MTADLQQQAYEVAPVLYMALELSQKTWRLAFGDGTRYRQVTIAAGDIPALGEQVAKAKAKLGLGSDTAVLSCFEAGRDSFWLHYQLDALGIDNRVVDAASIEVSRRARRAKTDRLDAQALLEKLIRYERGERRVWRVVRVPPPEWEDRRQLHRERDQLLNERTRHRNRLSSKLATQGLDIPIDGRFPERLEEARLFDGRALPEHLRAGLLREWQRLQVLEGQLRALKQEIAALIEAGGPLQGVQALMLLTGIGWVGTWTLVRELFGWREIANRRQLAGLSGLAPAPYSSGTKRLSSFQRLSSPERTLGRKPDRFRRWGVLRAGVAGV